MLTNKGQFADCVLVLLTTFAMVYSYLELAYRRGRVREVVHAPHVSKMDDCEKRQNHAASDRVYNKPDLQIQPVRKG